MSIRVTSQAFADGAAIPIEYTCDGQDVSPALAWSGLPTGSLSLALIVDDPDAPGRTFTHWLVYNLPPDTTGLPKGVPKRERLDSGGLQGNADFGRVGYGGPCPPRGPAHRYQFNVYALSGRLDLQPGASKAELTRAMEGKVLAQGRLTGTYQRR